MITAVTAMVSGAWGKIATYGAIVLGIIGFAEMERSAGKQEVETADLQAENTARKTADAAAATVTQMGDSQVEAELHAEFGRAE